MQPPSRYSTFPPVFVWLLLQIIAIGVSATRIPFYAKSFPKPAELLASNVMLAVQIGASAMLFPFLLRDAWATAIMVTTAWPFTVAAGLLTGLMETMLPMEGAIYVSLWLVGLGIWRSVLRSPRAQASGVAIAMVIAFGGPVAWYLRMEFTGAAGGSMRFWGPMLGAMAVANHENVNGRWMVVGGILGAGLLARGVQWALSHHFPPPSPLSA